MEPRAIAQMKSDLGLMLAGLREAKGWSQLQLMTEGKVRTSRSSIANTETGRQFPDERFWTECDQALAANGELLAAYRQVSAAVTAQKQQEAQAARTRLSEKQSAWLASDRPPVASVEPASPVESLFAGASRVFTDEIADVTRFASRIAAGSVASEALDFIDLEIHRIAGRFGSIPAATAAHDLGTLRRSVFETIERNHFPQQVRHLHLQAAQISGLTAHLLLDQGNYSGAESMANVAWLCADAAGHPEFLGWVRSVQSLIAYWNGDYPRAAALAADGMSRTENGTITVRLPGLVARAQGQMGDRQATVEALDAAEKARAKLTEGTEVDNGLFTFPERKQRGYASTALLALGHRQDLPSAVEQSNRAIELELERTDGRIASPDILAAYLDLSTAHLCYGDLDAAAPIVQLVLAAPSPLRTASIRKRLAKLESNLSADPYRRSSLAVELRHTIVDLRNPTHPGPSDSEDQA